MMEEYKINQSEIIQWMSKRLTEHFHMDIKMVDEIINRWNEPHRYYHDLNHLIDILGYLRIQQLDDDVMFLTAIFHDIVLDPTRDDNEERSVDVFMEMHHFCRWDFMSSFRSIEVVDNIMKTKEIRCDWDGFNRIDKHNLFIAPFSQIVNRTMLLFKEQQFLDYKEWKEKTITFLKKFSEENNYPNPDIERVIEFLHWWTPKIGIYCGSFNKFHKGHYNILQKAEKIFDKVIIARGTNPEKRNEIYELPEILKYHQIINYNGLLTDLMDNLAYDVILVRGLRNSTDLQYEMTQFQYLQDLKPDIKIINIFCDKEFEHISSSAIRSLETFGKGSNYLV